MGGNNEDVYVVGLLLVLVVLSAVPVTAGAALVLSGLLFLMTLVGLYQKGIFL